MINHDRRQQPRVEWNGEAIAAVGPREVRLQTRDLSAGGCCVETPWCPTLGDRLGVVLHVDGAPVGAWAEVAWACRADDEITEVYVWGLRFVELEKSSRARIEAFVDHCVAVEMLDEMLRGSPNRDDGAEAGFAHGEIEEMATRIFDAASLTGDPAAFFPVGRAGGFERDATSEIDVESTLTSEGPATHTVRVDLAALYASASGAQHVAPNATLVTSWDLGGHEPVDAAAPGWDDEPFVDDALSWEAASNAAHDCQWEHVAAPREIVIEPLPDDSYPPPAAFAAAPVSSDDGDPFWVEADASPAFPTHAPTAWPATATAPGQPYYATPQPEPYPQTPAPQQYDPQAYDPHAFDPQAFDPRAFVAAPAPAPAIEVAPLSADALLDLKRKRIDALLSSVPRRAGVDEAATTSNTSASESHAADKAKGRPRPAPNADTGLRRLFNQALRDINHDD